MRPAEQGNHGCMGEVGHQGPTGIIKRTNNFNNLDQFYSTSTTTAGHQISASSYTLSAANTQWKN